MEIVNKRLQSVAIELRVTFSRNLNCKLTGDNYIGVEGLRFNFLGG